MEAMVQDSATTPTEEKASATQSRRWHIPVLVTALALYAVLSWLGRPPALLTGQDDAEYALLGQSVRHGSYQELWRADGRIHAQYPPGYPAMIAVWGGIFGDSFESLVIQSIVLGIATLAMTFFLVRRFLGPAVAIGAIAVLAVSPSLVQAGGVIASELPYAFMTVVTLWLLAHTDRRVRWLGLGAAAAIFAALTRSVGITLAGAVGLHMLLERRWKAAAIYAAACALTIGGWLYWTSVAPEQYAGASYIADARVLGEGAGVVSVGFLQRVLRRAMFYTSNSMPVTMGMPTIPGTPVDNIIGTIMILVGVLTGLWVLLRRWRLAGIYLILFAGLLLAWPWRMDRFIEPLVPLLVPAMLAGWALLLQRLSRRASLAAVVVVATLFVLGGTMHTGRHVAAAMRCHHDGAVYDETCVKRDQVSYFHALDWIDSNTPEDAVFLTAKTGALRFYTGRTTASWYTALRNGREGRIVPYLRENEVDYVLLATLEQTEPKVLAGMLEEECEELVFEKVFPVRTYLFRLARTEDDRTRTGPEACAAVAAYRTANAKRSFALDP
jgi:MFS family permease